MRKICFFLASSFCALVTNAQNVGVGTSNPQNKLHVAGGLRLDTLVGVGGSGLLRHDANGVVYGIKFSGDVTDVLRGDGTFGSGGTGSVGWLLNGNGGTDPTNNFIGTTDNQPLVFKVNSIRHGYLGTSIFLGSNAGAANTGSGIIAIGRGALELSKGNVLVPGLVAIGDSALHNNLGTSGSFGLPFGIFNTAVGARSLYSNTSGSGNSAVGDRTMEKNTSGSGNSAFGSGSLQSNTTGGNNTAIGASASALNTNGSSNSAFGVSALQGNRGGNNNTALGSLSLFSNSSGSNNTAVGFQSLSDNMASENSALGYRAMASSTFGNSNNAFGAYALENNGGASYNNAFGSEALRHNNGYYNSAFGASALTANTTGSSNTAMGYLALSNGKTGFGNTGIGAAALYTITTGSYNTAIGYDAGYGYNPNYGNFGLPPDVSNVTCIGYDAGFRTTGSNQVNIGNFSVNWIGGNVGWGTYSDKRMKQDVKEDVPGLAFITRLKPVSYHISLAKEKEIAKATIKDEDWEGKYDIEKRKMTGFLAQDVEQAANEINYSFSGVHKPKNGDGLYSLEYSAFVVPLVKAVQEQQQIIEDQNKKIEKQQQQIDLLLEEVQRLKKDLLTQKN